jgi:hypothetical protein
VIQQLSIRWSNFFTTIQHDKHEVRITQRAMCSFDSKRLDAVSGLT